MNRSAPAALAAVALLGGCAARPVAALVPARLEPPRVAGADTDVARPSDDAARPAVSSTGPVVHALPQPPAETGTPEARVQKANQAARVEPAGADYDQAAQVYTYAPHVLYQVYAAPGRVTDIALQPGETLSGEGAIAAGDTARWIIGESVSGAGDQARAHILVKPTRADLATNLVLHTDRRSYLVELQARPDLYMPAVAWRYPHDEALALERTAEPQASHRLEPTVDLARLDFGYRIEGDTVPWRPLRAFDDGARVYIEFGEAFDASVLPPLFVRPPGGERAALVNYRIDGRRLIVDRLFEVAELRLADGVRDRVVRIERLGGRR